MKLYLTIFILMLSAAFHNARADFSYVYIQGDKKVPLYAKVEGVMVPRYGKNYTLLSRLAPGPLNVELLFQQNEYPALKFVILVPENGKRAFVLTKKDERFFLYDVEQNFYLPAGNTAEDDHLPRVITNATATLAATQTRATPPETTTIPSETTTTTKPIAPPATTTAEVSATTAAITKPVIKELVDPTTEENTDRNFIKGITFYEPSGTSGPAAIANSDCKTVMSSEAFLRLHRDLSIIPSEEEKLGMLQTAVKRNCFSSEQARQLTETLPTDLGRLAALREFYAKIADQSAFPALVDLLKDEEVRTYFLDSLKQ